MKRVLLAFPALAMLVLTQFMMGAAYAGSDHWCHETGYYQSYASYYDQSYASHYDDYSDHDHMLGGNGYQHRYGIQREYGNDEYRRRGAGDADTPSYGGQDSNGGREPSRTWKNPSYGSSPEGRDLAQEDRHTYSNQFRIPGHQPSGTCRFWYSERPAGHEPPPEDCRHVEGLIL